MKIVRFFGSDSESAINQAKKQLGEDAVIFSHRELLEGVEVLATVDSSGNQYSTSERSIRTHSNKRNEQAKVSLHEHLITLGFGEELADKLAFHSESINFSTPQTAIRDAHAELAKQLPVVKEKIATNGKTIALLGAESAGKTSTLIKLARQAREADDISELTIFSTEDLSDSDSEALINQIGLSGIKPVTQLDEFDLVRRRFDAKKSALTLIDTASLTQQDLRNPKQLITLSQGNGVANYLVLPATMPLQALDKIVASVTASGCIKGCIISMVDKAEQLGQVLTIAIKYQLPIALWTDGDNLDSHLYPAQAKHLVEKAIAVQRTSNTTSYSDPASLMGSSLMALRETLR